MAEFPTTRWSLVLEARADDSAKRAALEQLLAGYWKPLYLYARHRGLPPSDAEDAVQGLFARLLDHDFLRAVDPEKGRMRHYLRAAMRNYVAGQHEHAGAAKRGGNVRPLPLDTAAAEATLVASPAQGPDAAYDRLWATQVLENAFAALRAELADGRHPFEIVERYFSLDEAVSYDELAAKFAMTIPQLKSFLHRTRVRFRELVSSEVAGTVSRPDEVEEELAHLRTVLFTR